MKNSMIFSICIIVFILLVGLVACSILSDSKADKTAENNGDMPSRMKLTMPSKFLADLDTGTIQFIIIC